MALKMKFVVEVDEEFRDLFKRQKYEEIILPALNRSTKLIVDLPLEHVKKQSNSEPDFVDVMGNKYDVKVLFDDPQGKLLGERKYDLIDWFKSMQNEIEEFSEAIGARNLSIVKNMKLYDVMRSRLESVDEDEIAILFIPYPIGYDSQNQSFIQGATDFLQAVYDQLHDSVKCKKVYFLYPSLEEDVYVLRDAQTRAREFVVAPELRNIIKYKVKIV